jgi:hypothetical protein
VPQCAPKLRLLHHAVLASTGATSLDEAWVEQVTAKVIANIRHGKLARKFIVAYAIAPEDPKVEATVKAVGEVSDLPFDFWGHILSQWSLIFWHAPPLPSDKAWAGRVIIILVDLHGIDRLVRRLKTTAHSPVTRDGPGRRPVLGNEEVDAKVRQILERRPDFTQAQVIRRIMRELAKQQRFPSETTVGDAVRASVTRQGLKLRQGRKSNRSG